MLESFNLNNDLEYQKLSPEEQASRGILGRLKGVLADFKNPTRNGRQYTEDLWEQTFSNPIMKEKIENKCLFGELGHPADRQEVDMEKIAICLAETPKKGSDGKLYGIFDILATPCGKILKTLCDYGCNIGVSSRGSGDTYTDYNGNEIVDKDTFECECWDAVILPAVKEARLKLVTESLSTKKTLKQALCEAIESANDDDKKTMQDKLEELNIDISPEKVDNIASDESNTADDNGVSLVKDLQEALKKNQTLENQITTLQEKLSVSYTKEAELRDTVSKYKSAVRSLTEGANKAKSLEQRINSLNAELSEKDNTISKQKVTIERLTESKKDNSSQTTSLRESLQSKDKKISSLESKVEKLTESISKINADNLKTKETLYENIQELKKDSAIKHSEYSKKLGRANQLVEKYRNIANESINRYISSQANRLGVKPQEIKNRLTEGFSFDDIDRVCEELQDYKINISKLPFDVSKTKNVKMRVTESIEPIKPAGRLEDEIDDQLRSLAGL